MFTASLDGDVGIVEWAGDGRSMLVQTGATTGTNSVWSVPSDGGTPTLVRTFDDLQRPMGQFRRAGDRLFATMVEMESDVLVVEVVSGGG